MLKIELRFNNCLMEVECLVCRRPFMLENVAAVACDEEGNELANVCPNCVKAGEEKMKRFLSVNAMTLQQEGEELLQAAAFFEEVAAGEILCPSEAEWEGMLEKTKQF